MSVLGSELEAMSLEQMQTLASQVGVGTHGLDENQLREKLTLEGA